MKANLNLLVNQVANASAIADTNSTMVIHSAASEISMLALTAAIGDVAVRSDILKSYILASLPATLLSNWSEFTLPVSTVPLLNGIATATSGGMSGGPIIDHIHSNLPVLDATSASYTVADNTKLGGIATGATANNTDIFLLSRTNHTGTQTASTISDFTSSVSANVTVANAIQSTEKGNANGVATLDATGVIPTNQLPAIAITNTSVVASEVLMLALTAQVGDIAIRTDLNKSYILTTIGASVLANWQEILTPTDNVLSVNGQSGTIVLNTDNISEGSANLYYTDARVTANAAVVANTAHAATSGNPHNATTSNISEGTNLYYTNLRVSANADVAANKVHAATAGNPHGANSGNIPEGLNLYYTELRVSANAAVVANTSHAAATGNPHGANTDAIAEGVINKYYTELRVTNNPTVLLNTTARHTHVNAIVLNGTTASYTISNQSKLNGVATGATANSADSILTNRANHTGTQLASTISDFAAAVQLSDRVIATNAEALSGTLNTVDMTPLRTREAILNSKHIIMMGYALA